MTVYVECNADEALVRTLGVPVKTIVHAGNKGNVCKRLMRDRDAKGLVDADPGSAQPGCLVRLRKGLEQYGMQVLIDDKNRNELIVLGPRLEEWLLGAAKEAGLSVEPYGLSAHPNRLRVILGANPTLLGKLVSDAKNKSRRLQALESCLRRN